MEVKLNCWVENEWNYTTTPCIRLHVVDSNKCTFIMVVRPNTRYKAERIFCRQRSQIFLGNSRKLQPRQTGSNQVRQHTATT